MAQSMRHAPLDIFALSCLDMHGEYILTPIKKRKQHSMSSKKCSWVWAHFNRSETKKEFALCLLCNKEVYYSKDYSTSMLSRHINRFHKPVYTQHLVAEADKKLAIPENAKVTMDSFIVNCPKFEQALMTWMIATYQPLRCCEAVNFRAMCHSLNRKCPIIGKDKLRSLLNEQYIMTQTKMRMIMKGQSFAFTTDGWTSLANIGYVTCTAHFIDKVTWKLHSMVLGLFEKNGSSTAEDVVRYCTN
jgi:hypothetical protein